MDRKGIILLAVALLLATTAGWAAYSYLEKSGANRAQNDTTPVVVAVRDLTFGTRLETEHLAVANFPKSAVPRGAYAVLDSVLGQTSKVFLVEGEAVLSSKLSSVGGGLSVMVTPSMRAISLQIDQITGVSGFVLPGDRVDVLVTIDNAGGSGVAVTKTALQDAEVLAAGTTTEEKSKRTITTQAVTLLVTPVGAEAVALGQAQGKIHLVLRNPVDHELVNVQPTDTRTILGIKPQKSAPAPAPRRNEKRTVAKTAAAPTPAPPPPVAPAVAKPVPPSFTIIRDGNITKQNPATEAKPNP